MNERAWLLGALAAHATQWLTHRQSPPHMQGPLNEIMHSAARWSPVPRAEPLDQWIAQQGEQGADQVLVSLEDDYGQMPQGTHLALNGSGGLVTRGASEAQLWTIHWTRSETTNALDVRKVEAQAWLPPELSVSQAANELQQVLEESKQFADRFCLPAWGPLFARILDDRGPTGQEIDSRFLLPYGAPDLHHRVARMISRSWLWGMGGWDDAPVKDAGHAPEHKLLEDRLWTACRRAWRAIANDEHWTKKPWP